MFLVIPFVIAVAVCLPIEEAVGSREGYRVSRRPSDLAIRLGGYALITAFWFLFSWRPWLAAVSLVITVLVAGLIDRLKRRVIGEPLVFSDIALLGQVPQHPELYYTTPLTHPRTAAPLLLALGGVALWYSIEPTVPPRGAAAASAIVGLPLALLGLVLAARAPLGRRLVRARFPAPDLEADVARYGVLATMMAYALRRDREPPVLIRALADAVHQRQRRSAETRGIEKGLELDDDDDLVATRAAAGR